MDVGELFVKLGFKVDTKDLREFNTGMRDAVTTAAQLAGVTLSIGGFTHLLNGAAKGAVALENLSFKYGVATKSIQGFSNALLLANPNMSRDSALAATASMEHYAQTMSINGVGKMAMFGVTTADNTPEKLRQRIAENYERVSSLYGRAWANDAIREITGTDEALNGLLMTSEQFAEASKKGIISEEETKNLKDYAGAVQELSNNLNQLKASWLSLPAKGLSNFIGNINEGGLGSAISNVGHNMAASIYARGDEDKYYRDLRNDLIRQGKSKTEAADIVHRIRNAPASAPTGGQGGASYFEGVGWSKEQAAGIMQRLMEESGLNPQAVGDGGKAYGIAQWHPNRQRDFEAWSGHSMQNSTMQEQMEFVNFELTKGKEKRAGDLLKQTRSRADAHRIFTNEYERPSAENRVGGGTNNYTIITNGDAQHAHSMVRQAIQQTNMAGGY